VSPGSEWGRRPPCGFGDTRHGLSCPCGASQAVIADCDQRLARYRAVFEAGTDPTVIARWTAEVNTRTRMTASEINSIVTALGSILDVLRDADPADKAKIYSGAGLRLTTNLPETQ
jgi:hypothetical protein